VEIQEQRQGAVTVLKPTGPLVQADVEAFKSRAREVLSRSLGRVVLDTSAIPFADSTGLEALVDITEELAQSGQALKLCGTGETLREVLELTDLSGLFEHYEDVNTAVRSFL
jgi:anti-sigma B factor antagonist